MNWVRPIVGILVLWSSTAWGATLTWNANNEPDLGGYRIYQCSLQPCTKSSGNQSLLVSLGKITSFNIGTPVVTEYYFITAYDVANNESGGSTLVTFRPAGTLAPPPPPPPVGTVILTVLGNPATGAWGVEGTTTDLRNVMADVLFDGALDHVEHDPPYNTVLATRGDGPHTVQFIFKLEGTTTKIGQASMTVQEGAAPPPVGTVKLTILGNPATGAWGVEGTTTDLRNVMADVLFDGALDHVEHEPPYNTVLTTRGRGSHTVQFIFKLEGTTTEIGRASMTVQEGSS